MLGPEMNAGLDAGPIPKICGAGSMPGPDFWENLTSLVDHQGHKKCGVRKPPTRDGKFSRNSGPGTTTTATANLWTGLASSSAFIRPSKKKQPSLTLGPAPSPWARTLHL